VKKKVTHQGVDLAMNVLEARSAVRVACSARE
jgi:hypothetical protein